MSDNENTVSSLRHMREAHELSVARLASLAQVSASTITRIENGSTHAQPRIARHLAHALGTEPSLIAELEKAIPCLGRERLHLSAGDNFAGFLMDQEYGAISAFPQELADERLEG